MRPRAMITAILLLLAAGGTARAEDCGKVRGTWVDLVPAGERYLVPVTIGGTPRYLELSMRHAFTGIYADVAAELQLETTPLPPELQIGSGDGAAIGLAKSTFGFGVVQNRPAEYVVYPRSRTEPDSQQPRLAGVIGMNVFSGFDIDLDLAHNSLGLILQDHCPGQVVYWPHQGYGTTPLKRIVTGHIVLPMQLDGANVKAMIDTGDAKSFLALSLAKRLLDISESSPGMSARGTSERGEVFHYPFKTLTATEVQVANPDILIYRNAKPLCDKGMRVARSDSLDGCYGNSGFSIGLQLLRHLHLFFAFKEKMVYYTAAETPAAPAPAH